MACNNIDLFSNQTNNGLPPLPETELDVMMNCDHVQGSGEFDINGGLNFYTNNRLQPIYPNQPPLPPITDTENMYMNLDDVPGTVEFDINGGLNFYTNNRQQPIYPNQPAPLPPVTDTENMYMNLDDVLGTGEFDINGGLNLYANNQQQLAAYPNQPPVPHLAPVLFPAAYSESTNQPNQWTSQFMEFQLHLMSNDAEAILQSQLLQNRYMINMRWSSFASELVGLLKKKELELDTANQKCIQLQERLSSNDTEIEKMRKNASEKETRLVKLNQKLQRIQEEMLMMKNVVSDEASTTGDSTSAP